VGGYSDARLSRDEAAALLWSRHHAGLVRLAVALSGDAGEAEEIVQDAFATLLRRWWLLRDPAKRGSLSPARGGQRCTAPLASRGAACSSLVRRGSSDGTGYRGAGHRCAARLPCRAGASTVREAGLCCPALLRNLHGG
jgi:hypothetical protein